MLKWISLPIIVLLAYFNIWFTINAHGNNGLYDSVGMSNPYYWRVIYRYSIPQEVIKLKDAKEIFEGPLKNKKLIYENDFETDSNGTDTPLVIKGKHSLYIKSGTSSPEFKFYDKNGKNKWLRAQGTFKIIGKEGEAWRMTQFIVRFKYKGNVIKESGIRIFRWMEYQDRKDLFVDVKYPNDPFDEIAIYFYGDLCNQPVVVDDLKVWTYKG